MRVCRTSRPCNTSTRACNDLLRLTRGTLKRSQQRQRPSSVPGPSLRESKAPGDLTAIRSHRCRALCPPHARAKSALLHYVERRFKTTMAGPSAHSRRKSKQIEMDELSAAFQCAANLPDPTWPWRLSPRKVRFWPRSQSTAQSGNVLHVAVLQAKARLGTLTNHSLLHLLGIPADSCSLIAS